MYPIIKRWIDVLLAIGLLFILSPLFLLLAILLFSGRERQVFFRQERIGRGKKKFRIWKFATMVREGDQVAGGEITLEGDPRVTPLGHLLRLTKLNELPQLINVVKGEMSIVGPRPLIRKSFDLYPEEAQACLSRMRPGITGIGSIVFRNEAFLLARAGGKPHRFYRNHIIPYKGRLEHWYCAKRSFRTDFLLLLLTCHALFIPATPELIFRVFPSLPERPSFLRKGVRVELPTLPERKGIQ